MGVNATGWNISATTLQAADGFNGHPPLGVNATRRGVSTITNSVFSPTFQWAPTLGGECYPVRCLSSCRIFRISFNGHPPLGVNATMTARYVYRDLTSGTFQWAPTLGGECYVASRKRHGSTGQPSSFNGHPPLGVNATFALQDTPSGTEPLVSMGTHPWG